MEKLTEKKFQQIEDLAWSGNKEKFTAALNKFDLKVDCISPVEELKHGKFVTIYDHVVLSRNNDIVGDIFVPSNFVELGDM